MPRSSADDLRWAFDPVAFSTEALGLTPDPWQADFLRDCRKRVLLNVSRQSGKSTVCAIRALHLALYHPGTLTLLISPSLRQSSALFRKVADLYNRLPDKPELREDNRLSLCMVGGSRIVSLPAGEETIRSFSGVNLVIEDEASRVPDDLYRAVRPMLATSRGALVLASTPWGQRGHFYEEWRDGGPTWARVEVPAQRCPRIERRFLEEERSKGEWSYKQENECQFGETESSAFSRRLLDAAADNEIPPLFERPASETPPDEAPAPALPPGEDDVPPLFEGVSAPSAPPHRVEADPRPRLPPHRYRWSGW